MHQTIRLLLAAVLSLAFQGCLTDTGGGDSGNLDGEWFLTREIVSVTANGNTVADTVKADTSTFGRSYLVIEGSTFKFVDFDALFESMDTLQLDIQSLGGGRWLLDGDTIKVTRSGKLLRFTLSASGGYSEITEFTAYAGVFPPAEWTAASDGSDPAPQVWLAWRHVSTWSYGSYSESDTTLRDTSDALSWYFFRISGDTVYHVSAGATRVIATERVAPGRWLYALDGEGEEDEMDTLKITRTGNTLRAGFSGYDAEGDDHYAYWTDFVAYTGPFPPAEWASLMVDEPNNTAAQATPIVVDAAAHSAYLTEGDADYYSFTAQAGKRYRIRTFGMTYTALRLYGTSGTNLLVEAEAWESQNATITWTAPTSGTYYFSVRGLWDEMYGAYTVSIIEVAASAGEAEPNNTFAQANTIVVGAMETEASLTIGDADWYSFTAQAGVSYRIRTYGSSDTYLRLYSTNGTTILQQNDDDVGFNAGILWTAPSSGTYYFSVRGFQDEESGSYSVEVQVSSGVLLKKPVKNNALGKRSKLSTKTWFSPVRQP